MKKENFLLVLFSILLVAVLAGWYFSTFAAPQVALAPSGSAPSSVSVGVNMDIGLSPDLINGIDFGNASPGANDTASTDNTKGVGGITTLNVTRLPTTNIDIKLCLFALSPLNSSGAIIPIIGETYSNSSTATAGLPAGPALTPSLSLVSTSGSGAMTAVSPVTHYRFWLDIPQGTTPGAYTNTINFVAVQSTASC